MQMCDVTDWILFCINTSRLQGAFSTAKFVTCLYKHECENRYTLCCNMYFQVAVSQ